MTPVKRIIILVENFIQNRNLDYKSGIIATIISMILGMITLSIAITSPYLKKDIDHTYIRVPILTLGVSFITIVAYGFINPLFQQRGKISDAKCIKEEMEQISQEEQIDYKEIYGGLEEVLKKFYK